MKAISIRQPWAWLIVNGYKDIENRTWTTRFRGPVLIHAAKGMTRDEYDSACDLAFAQKVYTVPPYETIERGGIVGIANIDNCVSQSDSPWFFGPKGFILSNAEPLPFVAFKGALSFFDVPDDWLHLPERGIT